MHLSLYPVPKEAWSSACRAPCAQRRAVPSIPEMRETPTARRDKARGPVRQDSFLLEPMSASEKIRVTLGPLGLILAAFVAPNWRVLTKNTSVFAPFSQPSCGTSVALAGTAYCTVPPVEAN